jgi:hypothetical protein
LNRGQVITGIKAIQSALASLGFHYSESWVKHACSSRFTGQPIPVQRQGWGIKRRVWIDAVDLLTWAKAYRVGATIAPEFFSKKTG